MHTLQFLDVTGLFPLRLELFLLHHLGNAEVLFQRCLGTHSIIVATLQFVLALFQICEALKIVITYLIKHF